MRAAPGLAVVLVLTAWGSTQAAQPAAEVVSTSQVEWGPLNPARGDSGPRAANLWGDRSGPGPSGFLVAFVDGFSSPPHIHNVTYRAIAIHGRIHNDDPEAEEMWMPAGSFWTQPAGEVHVTAAEGRDSLAYIEIEDGPYLVRPREEAFDNGERPINVDPSNIVWLDASDVAWLAQPGAVSPAGTPEVAFLWRDPQGGPRRGTLVKLPAGFAGTVRGLGSSFRAVVIQGRPSHRASGQTGARTLEPGGYFGSEGESQHRVSCAAEEACLLYVRSEGRFDVVPAEPDESPPATSGRPRRPPQETRR